MKDKRKDQSLIEAYNNLMNLMLHDFPANRIHEIVAEDVTGYGTTGDEKIIDIAGLKKVVNDQRTQGRDKEIQFNVTPVKRKKMASGNAALFVDEIALTLPINGASKEIPIRLSSLFEYVDGAWKVVYLQGSVAESTDEDTWNMNEWREKNAELQKLLDEKTAELTRQNRELEIEAALERVRARAIAMQSSQELAVLILMINVELDKLDSNLDRSFIMLIDAPTGDSIWWMASSKEAELLRGYQVIYHDALPYINFLENWKTQNPAWTYELTGTEKQKWDNFIFRNTELAQLPPALISHMTSAPTAHWSASFNKYGCIATGSYAPLTHSSFDLMIRFSRMFEQTYNRFLDLQKAEAQAREAHIEAALERVRARAMAMHTSQELKDVVKELRNQIGLLGQSELKTCVIQLYDESPEYIQSWVSQQSADNDEITEFKGSPPKKGLLIIEESLQAYSSGRKDYTLLNEKTKLKQWMGFLKKTYPDAYAMIAESYRGLKPEVVPMYWSFSDFTGGSLLMVTLAPPADDSKILLRRFANVFGLAYQRFVDLQKAEAQAREAQIEAALEKVRSASMAMHHSAELEKVVVSLFDRLTELGLDFDGASIFLFEQEKGNIQFWVASKISTPLYVVMPYDVDIKSNRIYKDLWNAIKKGEDIINVSYSGKAKDDYYHYVGKYNDSIIPAWIQKMMLEAKSWTVSFAVEKNAAICIDSWFGKTTTEQNFQVIKRFARVFEQTYTRFLDLQKAEAQTREAQIEAALERVRSRTMAMHKSDELKDVVVVVFEKLKDLGLTFEDAGIQLYRKGTKDIVQWVAAPDLVSAPVLANLPYTERDHKESELIRDIWAAKENGKSIHNKNYSFDEKNKFFEYAGRNNDLIQIPADVREFQMKAPGYTQTLVAEKHSALWVDSYSGQTISVEEFNVLKRFAKVFEQAYTRFLDLQKAESQAREAQVEAALERVRSRSMGMQKSEDLREVVRVLYAQLSELGFQWGAASIIIMDPVTGDIDWWMEGFGDGYDLPEKYHVPYFDHRGHKEQLVHWKNGTPYAVINISGREKKSFDKYYFTQTDFLRAPEATKSLMMQQETVLFSMAYMAFGALAWSPNMLSDEQAKILQRFAKVFEQSYTRFLDLQKAEAQAREAQIEAALEKVRNVSLAMQKSCELQNVIVIVFEKLRDLGLKFEDAGISIYQEGTKDTAEWVAAPGQLSAPVFVNLPFSEVDFEESEIFRDFWNLREKGESMFNKTYSFAEKNNYFKYVGKYNDFSQVPAEVRKFQLEAPGYIVSAVTEKNSGIWVDSWSGQKITKEDLQVLVRVERVFEQAYTRFLDLQKAEAQAREAQIQLALERVRARTMAMHHSSELADAATILFDQLKQLGAELWTCGFAICDRHKDVVEKWMTSPSGQIIDHPLLFPISHPEEKAMYEAWKNGVELTTTISGEEDLRKSFENLITLPFMKKLMNDFVESGVTLPSWTQGCVVSFIHGYLLIITTHPFEETPIFIRFAKVFEQTYTRFLDLQKAETQAREAQIETALEKVRGMAMGMHNSSDLSQTVNTFFKELKTLGIVPMRCGVGEVHEAIKTSDLVFTTADKQGELFELPGKLFHEGHPIVETIFNHWQKQEEYHPILDREDMSAYYKVIRSQMELPPYADFTSHYGNYFYFRDGFFFTWGDKPLSEEGLSICRRFTSVLSLTYKRYKELHRAETQARESQIQLALERLRARTMAMHQSSELAEAASVLFEQLSQLGVSLWICGFNICKDESEIVEVWISPPDGKLMDPIYLPYTIDQFSTFAYEMWKNQGEMYMDIKEGVDLHESHEELLKHPLMAQARTYINEKGITMPTWVQRFAVPYKFGYLQIVATKRFDETDIFKRFARVFEQAYTRFLDLQKAEAQAREAQIQLALERVRARTMAMQKSDELREVVSVIYDQLQQLGFNTGACNILIMQENSGNVDWWMSGFGTLQYPESFHVNYFNHPAHIAQLSAWKRGEKFTTIEVSGKAKKEFDEVMLNQTGFKKLPGEIKAVIKSLDKVIFSMAFMKYGALAWATTAITDEHANVLQRFAKVFEQTYTRFLDLQKAEAQAREAQIETAMERVRARTMGMQKSEDLREVVRVLYAQLKDLGFQNGVAAINIMDYDSGDIDTWSEGFVDGYDLPESYHVPYFEHSGYRELITHWKSRTPFATVEIDGMEKKSLDNHYFFHTDFVKVPETTKQLMMQQESVLFSMAYMRYGALTWTPSPISDEQAKILQRFAKVFEQSYTRFLDLQRAEAQAREAQIEAALERVRSRSMAMHRSEELSDVILTVSLQLQELGFRFDNVSFVLNTEAEDYDFWFSIPGQLQPHHIHVPYIDNPINNRAREARSKGLKFFADIIDPTESRDWHQHMFNHNQMDFLSTEAKTIVLNSGYARSVAIMHSIMLVVGNYASKPYREDDNSIIRRFATVFEQTYTRFLDLKKVEGQAKEAQIETALEKVRSRSLAMHRSEELEQVVASLFDRLVELGFSFNGALIFTFDKERRNIRLWIATTHLSSPVLIDLPFDEEIKNNAVIKALWNAIENGEHIFNKSYTGETKNEYFRYVARYNESKVPESVRKIQLEAESWTSYLATEKNSILGFDNWSGPITTITDSDFQILLRFAKVFDQAYIRFLDLQKAEAREREAIKQASLDRVRAEIASMRTAVDLNRITPLIWRELTTLGVPFFRCGVLIVDSEAKKIDSYLSNPDGESLAAWRSDYDTIPLFTESVKAWKKQQVYITEWNEQQFIEFSQRLVGQGLIRDVKRYQAGEVAPEHLLLHMIPFRQGMLYVGSAEKLNNDQIELAQALASSFSVAYSRYEDFRQLEKAKSEVEYTLSELKSTQTQLIHAEKMASLGELTAGIAHEIQNPLNFVNNFSEVSKEMIEELKAERLKEKRDEGLEEELLNDINENLQKIHHHGQRASGIVKGMLQHSRTSSGQKEPTNINSLADEYLRLAYHGFRAKDKSFNANFKTDLDPSLPNVNAVGQDIGRVLLNLINNAFYVVSEKSKRGVAGYEPTVTVRTKRINHHIEITVKDNGDGIPANVINKIFQPFFTTKPTGEGTGLGLSLSYDIVTKGHNGSLEVDTTEGVGTTFIINLPL